MRAVGTLPAQLRSRLATSFAAKLFPSKSPATLPQTYCVYLKVFKGALEGPSGAPRRPLGAPRIISPARARFGLRSFSSEPAADSSKRISFESEELNHKGRRGAFIPCGYQVSRQLVALAEKYCKEGTNISPSQKFESFETREERPWDCLDTVEFVLDAEDMYGIVIPDEDADSFESIQDVVNFVVKAGADRAAAAKKN